MIPYVMRFENIQQLQNEVNRLTTVMALDIKKIEIEQIMDFDMSGEYAKSYKVDGQYAAKLWTDSSQ